MVKITLRGNLATPRDSNTTVRRVQFDPSRTRRQENTREKTICKNVGSSLKIFLLQPFYLIMTILIISITVLTTEQDEILADVFETKVSLVSL